MTKLCDCTSSNSCERHGESYFCPYVPPCVDPDPPKCKKLAEIEDRDLRQKTFIRVCQDSNFQFSETDAAVFAGNLLKRSPLEIWAAFSSLDVMKKIAAGEHPSARKPL